MFREPVGEAQKPKSLPKKGLWDFTIPPTGKISEVFCENWRWWLLDTSAKHHPVFLSEVILVPALS